MTPDDSHRFTKGAISIHMPHTWHDAHRLLRRLDPLISIHMPHTWHDRPARAAAARHRNFNPHATYVA